MGIWWLSSLSWAERQAFNTAWAERSNLTESESRHVRSV